MFITVVPNKMPSHYTSMDYGPRRMTKQIFSDAIQCAFFFACIDSRFNHIDINFYSSEEDNNPLFRYHMHTVQYGSDIWAYLFDPKGELQRSMCIAE